MTASPMPPLIVSPASALLHWADRRRWWIFAVCALVLFAGFNGKFRIEPDSALYLSLGRNLALDQGYTYHGLPHRLAYPGLPWVHALLFNVFGEGTLLPQHVLMLLTALATLALVYRLFLLHADRPTAVVMVAGLTAVKSFYRYSFELRNDLPFALGTTAFLCGWEALAQRQRRPIRFYDIGLLVLGLGLATVMRPAIWSLLLALAAVGFIHAVRNRRLRWRAVLLVVTLPLVYWLFLRIDPRGSNQSAGEYEQFVLHSFSTDLPATMHRVFTDHLPKLLFSAVSDAMFQTTLGPANAVFSLLVIATGVMLVRERLLWGVWIAVTFLMMLLILPLDRIALPILPLLVFAWWRFIVWISDRMPTIKLKRGVLFGLLAIGIGNNASRIGGYILVQHARDFYAVFDRGVHQPMIAVAKALGANTEPNSAVLIRHNFGREVSFLSRRDVYDRRDLSLLVPDDRPLYLVEPGDDDTAAFINRFGLRSIGVVPSASPCRIRRLAMPQQR